MNLKQGQEVRDAQDPNRIGIVVGTGSSLGARVLWCFDERLTWTSERPVVLPARTPADVLTDPQPGDRVEWSDGEAWRVLALDSGCVIYLDSIGRPHRMRLALWRESDANMIGVPHGLTSDVPPPAA